MVPETTETWKAVVGYEGLYEVSDLGRVRSVTRVVGRKGKGDLPIAGREMRLQLTPRGYLRVQLGRDGGHENHLVHTLVAEAFLGPAPSTVHEINHKFGIKTDNRVTEIEWVTPQQNQSHAYRSRLRRPLAKHVVICPALGVVTVGTPAMRQVCAALGASGHSNAGIHNAAKRGGSDKGMKFIFA